MKSRKISSNVLGTIYRCANGCVNTYTRPEAEEHRRKTGHKLTPLLEVADAKGWRR